MTRVLITGGRAPVALDLARSFAAAGATVVVADSAPLFLTRGSRAVAKAYRIPPPRQQPRAFADALRTLISRERIDLVVPTCEEVFYVSRYADMLSDDAELFCAPFSLLGELHNKWRFTLCAPNLGVDVPETWLLQSVEDVQAVTLPLDQLIFKPVFSRFAVHTLIRPDTAHRDALRPSSERPWIAQRFIEGRELCSYSVARAGRLTAHSLYQPTWRAGRGSGYYFQPVEHARIESFVARFVEKTNYTGQIAFDFIESPARDSVHVLECNPRATSGVHLFEHRAELAQAFLSGTTGVIHPTRSRASMLGSAMLCIGSADALLHRRLRAYVTDALVGRDVLWSCRDPVPAFYLFAGLGATLLTAARRGISPQAASTRDIEWDGEELP